MNSESYRKSLDTIIREGRKDFDNFCPEEKEIFGILTNYVRVDDITPEYFSMIVELTKKILTKSGGYLAGSLIPAREIFDYQMDDYISVVFPNEMEQFILERDLKNWIKDNAKYHTDEIEKEFAYFDSERSEVDWLENILDSNLIYDDEVQDDEIFDDLGCYASAILKKLDETAEKITVWDREASHTLFKVLRKLLPKDIEWEIWAPSMSDLVEWICLKNHAVYYPGEGTYVNEEANEILEQMDKRLFVHAFRYPKSLSQFRAVYRTVFDFAVKEDLAGFGYRDHFSAQNDDILAFTIELYLVMLHVKNPLVPWTKATHKKIVDCIKNTNNLRIGFYSCCGDDDADELKQVVACYLGICDAVHEEPVFKEKLLRNIKKAEIEAEDEAEDEFISDTDEDDDESEDIDTETDSSDDSYEQFYYDDFLQVIDIVGIKNAVRTREVLFPLMKEFFDGFDEDEKNAFADNEESQREFLEKASQVLESISLSKDTAYNAALRMMNLCIHEFHSDYENYDDLKDTIRYQEIRDALTARENDTQIKSVASSDENEIKEYLRAAIPNCTEEIYNSAVRIIIGRFERIRNFFGCWSYSAHSLLHSFIDDTLMAVLLIVDVDTVSIDETPNMAYRIYKILCLEHNVLPILDCGNCEEEY